MADRPTQVDVARLLTCHRPALYGYILACVRSHADAEDLFQEVSVAALQSVECLRRESDFLYWAREIARRRVLCHFRNGRREQATDPELVQRLTEAAQRLEEEAPSSERHEALLACLEALPAHSRRLIARRYAGAAGRAEALAREFGRSVQAVYAMVKRVKELLRTCVERRLAREHPP